MEAGEGGEVARVQVPVSQKAEVVLDTTKKQKRVATPQQLASLALAREKARQNRQKLKEAVAAAGSLENIVAATDGVAATTTVAEPVESGKRAGDAPAGDDVPLAKRTRSTPVADGGDAPTAVPAEKPLSSVSKGKGKAKKGAPLICMP
jgi:hypothetical protein